MRCRRWESEGKQQQILVRFNYHSALSHPFIVVDSRWCEAEFEGMIRALVQTEIDTKTELSYSSKYSRIVRNFSGVLITAILRTKPTMSTPSVERIILFAKLDSLPNSKTNYLWNGVNSPSCLRLPNVSPIRCPMWLSMYRSPSIYQSKRPSPLAASSQLIHFHSSSKDFPKMKAVLWKKWKKAIFNGKSQKLTKYDHVFCAEYLCILFESMISNS